MPVKVLKAFPRKVRRGHPRRARPLGDQPSGYLQPLCRAAEGRLVGLPISGIEAKAVGENDNEVSRGKASPPRPQHYEDLLQKALGNSRSDEERVGPHWRHCNDERGRLLVAVDRLKYNFKPPARPVVRGSLREEGGSCATIERGPKGRRRHRGGWRGQVSQRGSATPVGPRQQARRGSSPRR